jgi:TRAP-type C4-dicarboxylate transport system permease large subunit
MSKAEIIRSAIMGFTFGMLFFSGMPIELLLLLAVLLFVFIKFKDKIKPYIDNFFNNSQFFSKFPYQFRPLLTFVVIFIILVVSKQILYFILGTFFGINFNFEEYINN